MSIQRLFDRKGKEKINNLFCDFLPRVQTIRDSGLDVCTFRKWVIDPSVFCIKEVTW